MERKTTESAINVATTADPKNAVIQRATFQNVSKCPIDSIHVLRVKKYIAKKITQKRTSTGQQISSGKK